MRNHAPDIWSCDFPPVTDFALGPLFAFFIVELATRRVVHVGATNHPLRIAPALPEPDNDDKFGASFTRVAPDSGITILRMPIRAPPVNAVCERFLGSARRECLVHILVLGARHLARLLRE